MLGKRVFFDLDENEPERREDKPGIGQGREDDGNFAVRGIRAGEDESFKKGNCPGYSKGLETIFWLAVDNYQERVEERRRTFSLESCSKMGSHSSKVRRFSPLRLNSCPEACKLSFKKKKREMSNLDDHGVGGLESGSANDVSDLGSVDLAVKFLIVEVEDLFKLV